MFDDCLFVLFPLLWCFLFVRNWNDSCQFAAVFAQSARFVSIFGFRDNGLVSRIEAVPLKPGKDTLIRTQGAWLRKITLLSSFFILWLDEP